MKQAKTKNEMMTSIIPKHQFYGRRKGKSLRGNHTRLMEELLPSMTIDMADPLKGFGQKRILEIGFGSGEHLAHQAALNPDISYLGAEAFQNGVAKILDLIEAKNLTNVKLHPADVRPLLEILPPESFDRIYLLYPDPWPKLKQKKRRFVNAENLAHFARLLRPKGQFWFASDIDDYTNWTREHVSVSGLFVEEGDPSEPFENWIETRFEARARKEGRGSNYLRYVKK